MAIKGIDIIRRWVIQTRLKEQGKQGGVMITLPKKDFVDLNTSITAERLIRNGIDPNSITSVNQVENIINQINKPRVISQGDPEFSGIMGSNVIKRDFGKPFKEEIENQKRFFKGVEIKDPKFDENLPFDNDAEKLAEIRMSNEAYEQEIAERLTKGNKQSIQKLKMQKMLNDAIEDASPGFANDIKVDADLVAENLAERMGKVYDDLPTKERLDLYDQAYTGLSKQRFKGMRKPDDDPEDLATGGRVGLKAGMSRRAFLALMGSAGAGIGAAKTGLLKLFGKGAGKQATKEIIKTPPVPGKPEWFDNLVNKVITQGDDVTKKFATKERQSVHKLQIDEMDDVTVYRNLDDGEIRVSYDSPNNMGEQPVDLVFKPGSGQMDEVTGKVADEFYAVEVEPRGVRTGPDDFDIEFDGENLASSVDELVSDTSKLKQVATDKKPTMQEFVISKNKKDKTKAINQDQLEQAEYLETKYGPGPEDVEDFASGGIAGMINKRFDFDGGGSPLQRLRQSIVNDLLKNFPGIPEADLQIIVKDINLDMSPEEAQASMTANFSKLYGKAQGGIARMLGE
jgi:hypothetical protein